MKITNIAIFASGSGSNAEIIANYFNFSAQVKVGCFLSNNPDAPVLQRAKRLKIPAFTFNQSEIGINGKVHEILIDAEIDFIILAGYMKLIPEWLVFRYKDRLINIHPALLPKFGGKGMYGLRVHEAVIAAGEKETGITIHLVNSEYDKGKILFQAKCPVEPNDTPELLAQRVHQLEHKYYAKTIEEYILKNTCR